ncbi:Mob2p SCDLUD_000645 [Saccharomycodes ludwigii]|uniref:Mob2p n=1 Tax=Saccharomycodes ludwigii TaxID=36035 RepID=UPI001E8BFB78|nr:hypothetical protein SCDLUD_000645 [Saccharomycodes ludwigii]KAH3903035.1 hypothetical protein SCDLUD_000645 [Saccharomycodes ludwigii]
MSFFSSFRAFGRNNKKAKQSQPNTSNLNNNNGVNNSNNNNNTTTTTTTNNNNNNNIGLTQPSAMQGAAYSKPSVPSSPYLTAHGSNSKLSMKKHTTGKKFFQTSNDSRAQTTNDSRLQTSNNNSPVQTQQIMFLSEPFVRTSLVKGSFKTIVQLPKYVDLKEWVALNVFEFYTNLNQFYGVIAEYVTPEAYPTMNAGPHTDYLWLDANNRQVSLPASQYIDLALTWINNKINDKNLFPTKNGILFPNNFARDVQRIMIQLFRIFAHIYHHHFDKIVHVSLEAHWNSFFAHFISFCKEFNLIDRREMFPLLPLIENFEKQGKII